MGSESAPEISPAATITDTMTQEVATITPQAISNGESGEQVYHVHLIFLNYYEVFG